MSDKFQNNNIHKQKSNISAGIQTPINKNLQFCLNKPLIRWFCLSLMLSVIVLGNINQTFAQTQGWGWGGNYSGEIGDGTTIPRYLPVQVSGLTNITAIAAGGSHSLALRDDGTVYAWGKGTSGQLGNNASSGSNVPVQVISLILQREFDVVAYASRHGNVRRAGCCNSSHLRRPPSWT